MKNLKLNNSIKYLTFLAVVFLFAPLMAGANGVDKFYGFLFLIMLPIIIPLIILIVFIISFQIGLLIYRKEENIKTRSRKSVRLAILVVFIFIVIIIILRQLGLYYYIFNLFPSLH